MNSKTNSDNKDTNIATTSAIINDNDGQQQGVNLGSGSASVTSSAQSQGPADSFEQERFNNEVVDVLHLMTDRMLEIEAAQQAIASEALGSLRRADLSSARTLEDVCTMVEELWTEEMKRKYNPTFTNLFSSDGVLKDIVEIAPTLWAILSRIFGL